ncbi:MAG: aconitase X catalytic domain-containing protein [Methanofollis liminatans]|nr:aconitase X catalytic domain-containing protein [Methanofollis liminatans]
MFLEPEEQQILDGEFGETRQQMMELLVGLGTVFGAERLVPIASAQVSGASYKTIGRWGLEWLQGLDARVAVPTVLNPIGMDRDRWREMGVPEEFAGKQEAVIDAYERLGIRLECTCTPYYLSNTHYGEHLAWAESSAVAYANSVIGARTNREGGPGALAAAIVGRTPYYGLHIFKNRQPSIGIAVDDPTAIKDAADYGALGYVAGKIVGNRIPLFSGIRPNRDHLKALGAAMAATGAVALYHVAGITPEARLPTFKADVPETVEIRMAEVREVFSSIEVDAIAVGCPHLSPAEMETLAGLLEGKKVKKPFFVFAARGVIAGNRPAVERIERSGARVYADTCVVVSPALDRFDAIMVNSGKALAYVPTMCGAVARIGTMEECVAVATA